MDKSLFSKLDRSNSAFLIASPIVAVLGVWAHIKYEGFNPHMIWLFALMCMLTIFGISGGYHRLFAHRAFQANWWVKLYFLLFGAATFQNSALKWCTDHRRHHSKVDTNEDPYSINKGFFYAHIGWIFIKELEEYKDQFADDLRNDRLVYWQHKYYVLIASVVGVGIPTLIGWALGSPIGGFAIGGFLRLVVVHHLTFFINSLCHMVGKQTYSDQVTARDSPVMALLTFGEGYHNFHHSFQGDYRNGFRWYHWDPTKWIVSGFEKMGWASNLKRVSDTRVLHAKLLMDEKHMKTKLVKSPRFAFHFEVSSIETFRQQIVAAQSKFLDLKIEYRRLKQKDIKAEIRRAKMEFKAAYAQWIQIKRTIFQGTFKA